MEYRPGRDGDSNMPGSPGTAASREDTCRRTTLQNLHLVQYYSLSCMYGICHTRTHAHAHREREREGRRDTQIAIWYPGSLKIIITAQEL